MLRIIELTSKIYLAILHRLLQEFYFALTYVPSCSNKNNSEEKLGSIWIQIICNIFKKMFLNNVT